VRSEANFDEIIDGLHEQEVGRTNAVNISLSLSISGYSQGFIRLHFELFTAEIGFIRLTTYNFRLFTGFYPAAF